MLPARPVTIVVIRACALVLVGMLAPQLISFPPGSGLWIALFVLLAGLYSRRLFLDLAIASAGAAWFLYAVAGALDGQLDTGLEGDSILAEVRVTNFPGQRGVSTH